MKNLEFNTFSFVDGDWYDDAPSTETGWIYTFGPSTLNPNAYRFQMFIETFGTKHNIWIRKGNSSNENYDDWYDAIGQSLSDNAISLSTSFLPSQDLNDVISNGFYWRSNPHSVTNLPDNYTGYFNLLVSKGGNVISQYLITSNIGIYLRIKIGTNNWGVWRKVISRDILSVLELIGIASGTDLNDFTDAGYYYASGPNTVINVPNSEINNRAFMLAIKKTGSVTIQELTTLTGNYAKYMRIKVTNQDWREWQINSHRPDGIYYAFGDSTTYGQIGGVGGQSSNNYPNCVGKLLNMIVKNEAKGGQGLLSDWDYIHTNYINNLDMSDANLITVGWAYNDTYSSINFGDYTDDSDTTFIGKYYTIMKEFQQKCPTAQVILVTGFGSAGGQVGPPVVKGTLKNQFTSNRTFADKVVTVGEMYDELEKMCNLHGWPCVNQHHGCALNEFNAPELIGDQIHPTDEGYLVYGNHLAARIASFYANV